VGRREGGAEEEGRDCESREGEGRRVYAWVVGGDEVRRGGERMWGGGMKSTKGRSFLTRR